MNLPGKLAPLPPDVHAPCHRPSPLGAADASLIQQLWLNITSPTLDLGKEPIAQLEEAELLQLRVDLGVRSPQ